LKTSFRLFIVVLLCWQITACTKPSVILPRKSWKYHEVLSSGGTQNADDGIIEFKKNGAGIMFPKGSNGILFTWKYNEGSNVMSLTDTLAGMVFTTDYTITEQTHKEEKWHADKFLGVPDLSDDLTLTVQ